MFAITFLAPYCIAAGLLAVGLCALFLQAGYRARKAARTSYGEARLVDRYSRPLSPRLELLIFFGYEFAIILLSLAAAAPVMQGAAVRALAGSVDVVVVSDVSRSMASEEYRPFMPDREGVPAQQVAGAYGSRLDFVKHMIETRIMPAISRNRLGIITYSGLGFTQAELSYDHVSLRWILRHWMPVGGAPGNGSDFGSGLKEALQLFGDPAVDPDSAERQRVIVLFSDGGFTGNQQDLRQVIAELARRRVRLVIIGVGADQPSAIPQYSASGEMRGNLMRDGQTVLTHFEEEPLLALRAAADGEYIRLAPGETLNIEWARVLSGERVEIGERHLFAFPLSAALVLLGLLQIRGIFRTNKLEKEKV